MEKDDSIVVKLRKYYTDIKMKNLSLLSTEDKGDNSSIG